MAQHWASRTIVALLASCLISTHAVTQQAVAAEWEEYKSQLQDVKLGRTSIGDALGSVMDYQFSTPLSQMQSSHVYQASNARYRRVVHDLLVGNPINLVAIGGVATNGSDASNPGRNDYFALFVNYLQTAFPRAKVRPVRSSVGIAPSAVVAQCLDNYLPSDADLVLLEMTANDAVGMDDSFIDSHNAKAYEMVMRKVLTAPRSPALILTQSMVGGMGNAKTPYYLTPEAPQYAALASYYATPVVSMRNALWAGGNANANGLVIIPAVQQNGGSTPLDAGHRAMADMLVYNTQRTARDLVLLPYGDYDRTALENDVAQRPVYSDVASEPDTVLLNSTCMWVKNISSSRECPANAGEMCDVDFSSMQNMLRTYDTNVRTAQHKAKLNWALIGGIIGGVVGGLALLAALLACCIIKKKKHAEKIAAAAAARQSSKKVAPVNPLAVPISATATGPMVKV